MEAKELENDLRNVVELVAGKVEIGDQPQLEPGEEVVGNLSDATLEKVQLNFLKCF